MQARRSVAVTRPSRSRQPRQRRRKQLPRRHAPVALAQRVRLPRRAQIAQQRERIGVEQPQFLHVRDRQREPGALQQRGAVAQIGERRHPRRGAAGQCRLGLGQRLAQFRQRAERRQARQQQPVRTQREAQLDQRARQVVDPVQRQARHHQIEAARRERQELLVRRHRRPAVQRRHRRRQVAAHHLDAARAQQRRHHAAPADIQRLGEPPRRVVQPVEQPLGRVAQHVGDAAHRARGAVAMAPHGATVEHLGGSITSLCARRPSLPSVHRRA